MSQSRTATVESKLNITNTVFMLVLAVGSTLITLGVTYGTFSARMTAIESTVDEKSKARTIELDDIRKQMVPRSEHAAHWQSEADALKQIQEELREIRAFEISQARANRR